MEKTTYDYVEVEASKPEHLDALIEKSKKIK